MSTSKNTNSDNTPKPGIGISLTIILVLIFIFVAQLVTVGAPDVHLTLIFATVVAVALLLLKGIKFEKIQEGIMHGCNLATISMLILMFIGVMIPAWVASGTIPTLIYYGLQILSPNIFLVATVIICSVSALCTGTSWGTVGTFGVALMGIGLGLGVPAPMTAAFVITGAIFGDKLSPLSDTVNLSAAACEVDIFKHIKSCLYTTLPAYVISLAFAVFLGFKFDNGVIESEKIDAITETIAAHFNITPMYALISLIPLIFVLVLSYKKINSLAVIVAAGIIGMVIAMIFQGQNIIDMMSYMNYGFKIDTGNVDVDKLFNRGGLQSMMFTVSLGYIGLSYGGILEKTGVMSTLLDSVKGISKNARSLILSQTIAGFLSVALTSSSYMAILLPGRMFTPAYKKMGVKREVASRTCETSGICLDPLLPWTTTSIFFTGALGVGPMAYGPYAIFLWIIPIISVVYACTGFAVWKEKPEEIEEEMEL